MFIQPKLDSHTIVSAVFTKDGLVDYANRTSFSLIGGDQKYGDKITADPTFGYAFSGKNASFYSFDLGSLLSNNHDFSMECWFICSSMPFHGCSLMQLADSRTYADDDPSGTYSRCGLQFCGPNSGFPNGDLRWDRCRWNFADVAYTFNAWHHAAFVKSGNTHMAFLDGRPVGSGSRGTKAYGKWFLIGQGWTGVKMDEKCRIAHVRLSDIARYTSSFNVNNVYRKTLSGLFISQDPIDFYGTIGNRAINVEQLDVANTRRRLVFKVDNVWNKLVPQANGQAALARVPTQNISAASVLNEGNTAAEVNASKNVPAFADKVVYPAIAMDMNANATEIPKAKVKAVLNFPLNKKKRKKRIMSVDSHTMLLFTIDGDTAKDLKGAPVTNFSNISIVNSGDSRVTKKVAKYDSSSSIITVLPSNMYIGGSDFTIDFWIYNIRGNRYRFIFSLEYGENNSISYMAQYDFNAGGTWDYAPAPNKIGYFTYATYVNVKESFQNCRFKEGYDKWQHYAIVYQQSTKTSTVYVDGAKVASEIKEVPKNKVTKVKLGDTTSSENSPVGNMISTFRISNYARWTSNFTPPQCV